MVSLIENIQILKIIRVSYVLCKYEKVMKKFPYKKAIFPKTFWISKSKFDATILKSFSMLGKTSSLYLLSLLRNTPSKTVMVWPGRTGSSRK